MNITNIRPVQLATSQGKYVSVQSKRRSHQLVTVNQQIPENTPNVKVYDISDDEKNKTYVAFCFEMKGKSIFPVVTDGKDVEFMVLPSQTKFPASVFDKSCLFQWVDKTNNSYGCLKSVAKPSKYLFVEDNEKVAIGSVDMPDFRICDQEEKEGIEMRSALKTPGRTSKHGFCYRETKVVPTNQRYPKRKIKNMNVNEELNAFHVVSPTKRPRSAPIRPGPFL